MPGLRRDELARLAGVGLSYYTRLEQGGSLNASPEVLEALARALDLDEVERAHLHDLAAAPRRTTTRRGPAPERIGDATRQLADAFGDTPALVLGRRSDVLAWNRTGHALFAGHLDPRIPEQADQRPNMARLVFLDAHTRDLFVDWPKKARNVVGKLRLAAGRHPDDPRLASLIGELTMKIPEFATMWAAHGSGRGPSPRTACTTRSSAAWNPTLQSLNVPGAAGQRVVVATAGGDSASAAALCLLARLDTPTAPRSVPAAPGNERK
ncbi:helix-turn-helix domain-containing protein [Streptomyces sp. NPDC010273]|uniref:helix-turn-helix transcriptional regulator n=1 Tax=Streptomyces sp. NPDC010273 TaxID=3364829 RepID=UPI0036E0DE53